jgi:hypothetical protein
MARRVLRAASVALASGAGVGILFGGVYMRHAIEGWDRPGMSGLLAGWAAIVWIASAGVAALASWTWRTTFKKAAIALTLAGSAAVYLAVLYLGHDFTPWASIALGTVSVLVLTPTAAAYVLSRREARTS